MRRLVIFICSSLFATIQLFAQKDSIKHSQTLEDVVVVADLRKYQAGAKIEAIPSEQLQLAAQAGADQLLMRFTPIYIKSNAGALATIRFRGTSANHTAVNFGGINVNSLTLGHSNMSSMPVFLFDEIGLQYGSASVVSGSGAIGGSLNLGLASNWTNGLKVSATSTQGSFGEQMYGAKVFAGNGKFESVTRAFYYSKENNFNYISKTWDFSKSSYVNTPQTQRNASIENMGLLQELNYRFADKVTWKNAFWLENDWHEIQQNMATNESKNETSETLEDQNIRFWSEFKNEKNALKYRLSGGYVHDYEINNKDKIKTIGTDRLITEFEVSQDIKHNLGYKFGTNQKYMVPHVYSYNDSLIKNELQSDYYISAYYIAFKRAKFTLNLRQMFASDFNVPFTPSLGMDIKIINGEYNALRLLGNISRSYRIPTFNDRFWGDQGNPNLKPEDAMNYELALNYAYCSKRFLWETKINTFYMDVNQWIEWRLIGKDWQANNLMEVESKGIEFSQNILYRVGKSELNGRLNFTLNPVTIVEDPVFDIIDQQVIYTPKQMGNAYLSWKYAGWMLSVDGTYTGIRHVDYLGNTLPFYYLCNTAISKQFKYNKHNCSLGFSIYNLFDKSYQNDLNYAMPGRNFKLNFIINLNYLKTKNI